MHGLVILFIHVVATLALILCPGGVRSVVAESRSRQATTPDPQSVAAAITQSPGFRSPGCRFVCSFHSPYPPDPFRHRAETFDLLNLHKAL